MTRDLLLGVDVGTTLTKVGAFDVEGRLVAFNSDGYPLETNMETNAAEQNPADWWTAAAKSIRKVVNKVEADRILAISIGGQGPTLVALNENLEPVSPALTWMDLRATLEAQKLGEAGFKLPPHLFMPKSMWLKTNRHDAYKATKWFCQAWDYVAAQLIGELVVSYSPGIAPWTPELIEAAELDPSKFSSPKLMGDVLGQVSLQAARDTGLKAGTPVIGGISDFFEGVIGSGAVSRGQAIDNGGTSGAFSVCWHERLENQALLSMPSFMEGMWHAGGPVSTSGKALDWWIEEILEHGQDDYTALEAAAAVPAGSERLIFLPYLAGERAPIWNPQARGVFFGLSLDHKQAHLTRSILEAVAFTLCHLIDHIEIAGGQVNEIRSIGGQAKSETWCQIKADATGRRVTIPEITDTPMLGAATIAGVGIGVFDNFRDGAKKMSRLNKVIEPDLERHEHYKDLFEIYQELYKQVLPLYERMSKI